MSRVDPGKVGAKYFMTVVNGHAIKMVFAKDEGPLGISTQFRVGARGPTFATEAEAEVYARETKEIDFDYWRIDDWRRFERFRLKGKHDMTDPFNKRTRKALQMCIEDLQYVIDHYDALSAAANNETK